MAGNTLNIAEGLQYIQDNFPDNTTRLITELLLRDGESNIWKSFYNRLDDRTLLGLRPYEDREYDLGECCTFFDGSSTEIYEAIVPVIGGAFNPAEWSVLTSSTFTLTDGNGTTANGTAVDLGGDLAGYTYINGNNQSLEIGSLFLGMPSFLQNLNIGATNQIYHEVRALLFNNVFNQSPNNSSWSINDNTTAESVGLQLDITNGFRIRTNGFYANLKTALLAADRNFEFPDKDGTIALLSDVGAGFTLTDGSGTTANGTAVDLGGLLDAHAFIDGDANTRGVWLQNLLVLLGRADNIQFESTDLSSLISISNGTINAATNIFTINAIDLLTVGGGAKDLKFDLLTDGIKASDASLKGLFYADDYSVKGLLDPQWLPNWGTVKDYVDNSSTFTLTDGSGTTANGTAVDLGGDLGADVFISAKGKRFYLGLTFDAVADWASEISFAVNERFAVSYNGIAGTSVSTFNVDDSGTAFSYSKLIGNNASGLKINDEGFGIRATTAAANVDSAYLRTDNLTDDRIVQFQDQAGTLALLSDIPSVPSKVPQTLTDAASIAWNLNNGINAKIVIAGNRTLNAPTNISSNIGESIKLRVESSGAGRTLAFNSIFKFGGGTPAIKNAEAGSIDLFSFYVSSATELIFEGSQHNIS